MSEKIKEQLKQEQKEVPWRQIEKEIEAMPEEELSLFEEYEEKYFAAWRQVSEKREKILEDAGELLRARFGNEWKRYLGMWRAKKAGRR